MRPVKCLKVSNSSGCSGSPIAASKSERQVCFTQSLFQHLAKAFSLRAGGAALAE